MKTLPPYIRYIGKRLVYAAVTVWVLVTVTFLLMQLLPGDPFTGEKVLKPEIQAALTVKYGLDRSIPEQYAIYIGKLLQGDFGSSLITGREVTAIIAQAFPVSFELGIRAWIFAVTLGILLGIVAALKHGSKWDTVTMLLALLGVSLPSFILGALLQYFFGIFLAQLTGVRTFAIMGWQGESSKLLPAFALAFGTIAAVGRLMRASMLEVLGESYISTARAKGHTELGIVFHHGLRNALAPIVTVLGPITAVLLTGTFAVEHVFSIPGLGKYFVDSLRTNDYPVIVGTTLFFGTFLVLCNFAAELLNGFLDPRIGDGQYERKK